MMYIVYSGRTTTNFFRLYCGRVISDGRENERKEHTVQSDEVNLPLSIGLLLDNLLNILRILLLFWKVDNGTANQEPQPASAYMGSC